MKDAVKSGRPSKRDIIVIDDDESANEQPAVKSIKREEEPVPSPEVAELQQEVAKWKDKFQRSCVAARTAELRAEAAESRLDSKHEIKEGFDAEKNRADDLEIRLAEVSSQLEESRKIAENVLSEKNELAQELDALKIEFAVLRKLADANQDDSVNKEHQKWVKHLTSRLEEEKQRSSDDQKRYRERIDSLKHTIGEEHRRTKEDRAKYRTRVENLTDSLEASQRQAEEDRSRYRARIDELTEELAQYEEGPQPVEIDHSYNIFKMCEPHRELPSYEEASMQIISAVHENEGISFANKVNRCLARSPKLHFLMLHCEACKKTLPKDQIFPHFFSNGHEKKVRTRGAAISDTALRFWLDKLKPATAVAAERPIQHPTAAASSYSQQSAAAAAASPETSEASMDIKMEEEDEEEDDGIKKEEVEDEEDDETSVAHAVPPPQFVDFRNPLRPFADTELTQKVFDLIQQAARYKQLASGAKYAEKALESGISELIVIAVDFKRRHRQKLVVEMVALCKKKNVPYVFVESKTALGIACGSPNHVNACSITRNEEFESLIRQIKKDVEKLL